MLPMKHLSTLDIAKLCGISRMHAYRLAPDVPGATRAHDRAAWRFPDTPALREWCKQRVRQPRRKDPMPVKKFSAMREAGRAIKKGQWKEVDRENALALAKACKLLWGAGIFGPAPLTKGVLALLAQRLVRSDEALERDFARNYQVYSGIIAELKSLKA
jgi:hypothetical protein